MFKTLVLALALLGGAPKPVITVDGVAAATRISATTRAAITAQIQKLNAQLEKMRDNKAKDPDLKAIHEECMALHDAIVAQLDPEQRHAFAAYLHAQLEAAGIDVSKLAAKHHAGHH